MTKAKLRAGVSRRVKISQLGLYGLSQTVVYNQAALAREREALKKKRLEIYNGTVSHLTSSSFSRLKLSPSRYLELGSEGKRLLEEFATLPPLSLYSIVRTPQDQSCYVALYFDCST
jgi:hypothetical protein